MPQYASCSSLLAFPSPLKRLQELCEAVARPPFALLLVMMLAAPLAVGTAFTGTAFLDNAPASDGEVSGKSPFGNEPSNGNLSKAAVAYAGAGPAEAPAAKATSAKAAPSATAAYPADPVSLPIRVMGLRPSTRTVTLHVDDPAGIERLWMQVHRPAYRDQQTNPGRGAKASVRVNGSDWVDLTNETARVEEQAAQVGGIGGGFHTVRLSVPVSGVRQGENVVEFRFNGTDGLTSGYRVLKLNFLRGTSKVLPASAFTEEDPSTWAPPQGYDTPADINEGKRLWHEAKLVESREMGRGHDPIKATCSGCHTEDGHDLKYFAYANETIQARSAFHGLSEEQGKQIAAYIRSIELRGQDGQSYAAPGRPWNPPYQPAPGLGEKDVALWAAGGGLEWVLEEDAQMWDYLVGDAGSLREAFAPDKDMKVYDQPVAMQLPDWNQWLPEEHPRDVFGSHFENTAESDPQNTFRDDVLFQLQKMKRTLREQGVRGLVSGSHNPMAQFGASGRKYYLDLGNAKNHIQDPSVSGEQAELTMKKWTIVKIFQEMQKHHLADDADVLFDEDGEGRSWLSGNARTTFEVAPHISADNTMNFRWQSEQTGVYFSTAWYHVQLVVNAGNDRIQETKPIDWGYQPAHINGITFGGEGAYHALRQAQTFAKMLQLYTDDDRGLEALNIRQTHPGRYGPDGTNAAVFERMTPDRRRRVYEALLSALMDRFESHSIEEWSVHREAQGGWLEPRGYTPRRIRKSMSSALHDRNNQWADAWYTVIPRFREVGVDVAVLRRMIDWGKKMWPKGDWARLRSDETASIGKGTGLEATYFADKSLTEAIATHTVSAIDLDVGGGTPVEGLPRDGFSVRWTGQIEPKLSGNVTFYTDSDDGVRLWVDGQQVIDAWWGGGGSMEQGSIELEGGKRYDIRLEYYENRGGARMALWWDQTHRGKEKVPTRQLYHGAGKAASKAAPSKGSDAAEAGLTATYFADKSLTEAIATRTVSAIDFDAGDGAPVEGLPADGFSVRWTGQIEAKHSGTTTFYTDSDDGVRLWVDGQQVIDTWQNGGNNRAQGSIELEAGQRYDLRLEYYENRGEASMSLAWSTPEGKARVSASQFYRRGSKNKKDASFTHAASSVLDHFTAKRTAGGPHLQWTTRTETESRGFQVWRKVEEEPAVRERSAAGGRGPGNVLPQRERDLTKEDLASEGFEEVDFIERQASGGASPGDSLRYRFTDETVPYGAKRITYHLVQVGPDGNEQVVGTRQTVERAGPSAYVLEQPFPNPFRDETTLRYRLKAEATVSLEVYDALGRKVRTLVAGESQRAGRREVHLDAQGLASGVYFARLIVKAESGTVTRTRKLVLVR